MKNPPLCKDCKFCGLNPIFKDNPLDQARFSRCARKAGNLITGELYSDTNEFCSIERKGPAWLAWFECGPSGRYFQPKEAK